jgi:hypothetical protein
MPLNTSVTGALLAHDKVDRYRSFGAFGKPAYQSHVQLRAMLRSKRGNKFADYFAKPTVDPEAGELRWTAEVPGAARAWSAMNEQEQADRALELEVIRSGLLGYAQELRKQGGDGPGGAAAFASLLEQAMKVPAQGDFLYFVGDQPVIAFWGFEDATRGSVDPAARAPRFASAPAGAPPSAPVPPEPVAVEAVRKKRPWWWWLLWLLLGLLLLALLLLLPRACAPAVKRVAPSVMPTLPSASAPGTGTVPGTGGTVPGTGGSVDGGAPDTTVPRVAGPAASGPSGSNEAESPEGGNRPPAADDKQAGTKEPPTGEPQDDKGKTQPPLLPDAKDSKDGKDAKDAKDAKDGKNATPPPGAKSMKLPDAADAGKNMGFLEGQWKAGEGLFDKKTGQPLDLSLKFGKDGRGDMTMRRPDGTTCSGSVQGRMNGGKLGIEGSQSVPCSDGSSYGAPRIECQKESGGQTQCYGVNADGSRYFMDMARP